MFGPQPLPSPRAAAEPTSGFAPPSASAPGRLTGPRREEGEPAFGDHAEHADEAASTPARRSGAGVQLRRRGGFAHGDNTGGALRFAPSLSHPGGGHPQRGVLSPRPAHPHAAVPPPSWVPHGHPGTRPAAQDAGGGADRYVRAPEGSGPRTGAPNANAEPGYELVPVRLAQTLPLHLLPLLGSLPAARNNLRHAQRTVAWWRTFHAREQRLAVRARTLDGLACLWPPRRGQPTRPGARPTPGAGGDQAWPEAVGCWRNACARERFGVRVALREAHFSLAFNAVELGTYLAGAVPLLTPAAAGAWAQAGAALAVRAVPALLLASGVLHVAQQASWLRWMAVAGHAAATAALPEPLRGALVADLCAGRRAHAVQLGLWSGFCVGVAGAGGALAGLGLGPLLSGTLAAASMLGSRAHRLAAPRRLEVPEHVVWRRAAGQRSASGPHHASVFGDVAAQAAAWARLQAQAHAAAALRRTLTQGHARGAWGALWRLLLAMPPLPGVSRLLGAVGRRALAGRGVALTRAALGLQREMWRAQATACAEAQARAESDIAALAAAPSRADAAARTFVAQRLSAGHHLARRHAQERRRLEVLAQQTQLWAARADVDEARIWRLLGASWGLCSDAGGDGAQLVGAYLVAVEAWLEDVRGALLWGAALGVAAPRVA